MMKSKLRGAFVSLGIVLLMVNFNVPIYGEEKPKDINSLNAKEQSIIRIAAVAAKGDLKQLTTEINQGLDAGLTINQIKETFIHLYAYAGFPRSLRGLQTMIIVLDERKAKGIEDTLGADASEIKSEGSKYNRGKAVLEELTGTVETGPKKGYAAFAPTIEIFLKEHLFADLFERDVLTYAERELVTISVLSGIGGVEPMLNSHLAICLKVGYTENQLEDFVRVITDILGKDRGMETQNVLVEVLGSKK